MTRLRCWLECCRETSSAPIWIWEPRTRPTRQVSSTAQNWETACQLGDRFSSLIVIYKRDGNRFVEEKRWTSSDARSPQLSPDGRYLIFLDRKDAAEILDVRSGRIDSEQLQAYAPVGFRQFSPKGHYLAIGKAWNSDYDNSPVDVFRVTDWRKITSLEHRQPTQYLSFSRGDKYVVSGSQDGELSIVNLSRWPLLVRKLELKRTIHGVAFDDAESRLAAMAGSGLSVRDLATGREVDAMPGTEPIAVVSFSPDGRYLASGEGIQAAGKPYFVRIWPLKPDYLVREAARRLTILRH